MGFLSFLIRLNGDNTGFKNMLGDTSKITDQWAAKLQKGFGGMLEAYAGMRLIKMELNAINAEVEKSREIKFGAQRLGTTWEQFQRIQIQAEKANASIEDVTMAIEKLGEAQAEIISKSNEGGAGMGSEKGRYAKMLGLREDDLQRDPLENFLKMRSQFQGKRMSGEQRAAMKKLYGKGGARLIPMFENRDNPTDFAAMRDDDEIAKMLAVGSNTSQIKKAFGGMMRRSFVTNARTKDPQSLETIWNGVGNIARHFNGDPDAFKSAERRVNEMKKQNLEFAEREKGQFQEMVHLLEEEEVAEGKRKQHKIEEAAVEKELKKNIEARVALSRLGMTERQKLEDSLTGAQATMKKYRNDKDHQSLFLEAETSMLQAKAGLRAMDDKRPAYSPTSLERTGGFIGSRQDPLIDINRQQLDQLRRIGDQVQELNRRTGKFTDNVPRKLGENDFPGV